LENLTAIGARLLEPFAGATIPVKVECVNGHICYPQPTQLWFQGICKSCNCFNWDTVYIVGNEQTVKVGITGDWNVRKRVHAAATFTEVILVQTELSIGIARFVEQYCLINLRRAGHVPVRGREYFAKSALEDMTNLVMEAIGEN